jgi:hypothetical protein
MAQRIRLVVEWTLALFLYPPLSKLDLNTEQEMLRRYPDTEAFATEGPAAKPGSL